MAESPTPTDAEMVAFLEEIWQSIAADWFEAYRRGRPDRLETVRGCVLQETVPDYVYGWHGGSQDCVQHWKSAAREQQDAWVTAAFPEEERFGF